MKTTKQDAFQYLIEAIGRGASELEQEAIPAQKTEKSWKQGTPREWKADWRIVFQSKRHLIILIDDEDRLYEFKCRRPRVK